MAAVQQLVDSAVLENKVAVFSKSWCPYCKRAKALLSSTAGISEDEIKVFELDERNDGDDIQSYLKEKTGQSTVPNVFIKQKHIGGSDALTAFSKSGGLKELLGAA